MKYNVITWRALAQKVLVVATRRVEGTWCAYCDAVPGDSYEAELEEVCAYGCKLHEPLARAMFPHIEGPYGK